jgi:hypothetical protein
VFNSEHNQAQGAYEDSLRQAKASSGSARQSRWKETEDNLVAGGIKAIEAYEQGKGARQMGELFGRLRRIEYRLGYRS